MSDIQTVLLGVAVAMLVGIGYRTRYRQLPAGLESLLYERRETIDESEPQEHSTGDPLADGLLRHFEESLTSTQVLRALVDSDTGLDVEAVAKAVNAGLASRPTSRIRRPLPDGVIETVLKILIDAGFAKRFGGAVYRPSTLGSALYNKLVERKMRRNGKTE